MANLKQWQKQIAAALSDAETLAATVREIADEARAEFDEMSDKAQEGERGQKLSDFAESVEAVADELETAVDSLSALAAEG